MKVLYEASLVWAAGVVGGLVLSGLIYGVVTSQKARLTTLLVLLSVAAVLLSACGGLPTLPPPADAPAGMAAVPTPTPTAVVSVVTVTGNVWVRDNSGVVKGLFYSGSVVNAECAGDWCVVSDGNYAGLFVWRGCTDNNPKGLGCQEK